MTGEKARLTFEKSGLPPSILGEIWQFADSANMGFLTQFGFCFAMRLIGYTQSGQYPTAQLAETPGPLPKFSGLVPPGQLMPQTTSSSLLQTQPSSYIPPKAETQAAPSVDEISPVSSADYERFSLIFEKTTGSKSAPLDGNAAKEILTKAKLPTHTLGQIWSLVDINNKGLLDLPAFVMAMHLIHGLLSGGLEQLPLQLPEYLWRSVQQPDTQRAYPPLPPPGQVSQLSQPQPKSIPPQDAAVLRRDSYNQGWVVSNLQKEQFDSIFDSLDTAKTGTLGPVQVANFLKTSRLDQLDLATIWDLSDVENTGIFTKFEFSIALVLVNRRRSGMSLPNVVPASLLSSLRPSATSETVAVPTSDSVPAVTESKTSALEDLADIFGGLPPASVKSPPPVKTSAPLQGRSSSSDLTYSKYLTKTKPQMNSSFAPTSEFGKSLMAQQPDYSSSVLIGDYVPPQRKGSVTDGPVSRDVSSPLPAPSYSPQASKLPSKSSTADYETLRNVPAPPRSRNSYMLPPPSNSNTSTGYSQSINASKQENTDLLADAETAGKLSEANTDIANISNQVKSLTTQTSNLHDKKVRADQELARILKLKEDIDAKLKLLRTSYANEVKQVEQVETTLGTAKEEAEALRSEASIAEAKLNHLSGELHEKQLAVEEHQKLNSTLREKLGNANAEIAELSKQLESKSSECVRLENEAHVRKSQHEVSLIKINELNRSLADYEAKNVLLQQEIKQAGVEAVEAEAQIKELQKSVDSGKARTSQLKEEVDKIKASAEEAKKSHSAASISTAAAGVPGAAILGAVGAAAIVEGFDKRKEDSVPNEVDEMEVKDAVRELLSEPVPESKVSSKPLFKAIDSEAETKVAIPGAFEKPSESESKSDTADSLPSDETNALAPISVSDEPAIRVAEPPVAALVDEVVEHPAVDLNGLEDIADCKGMEFETPTEYEQEEIGAANDKFPEVSTDYDNYGSVIQASTNSYKPTEGGRSIETPVTSPDVSEYRFQTANVVGGLVGMPGVLVGVQRTDSLTSSIQNNPSMSVRDDNIDEVSDREALDEVTLPQEDEPKQDGERSSLVAGLFEIVTSEEAKEPISGHAHPLSRNFKVSDFSASSVPNKEEFPPIRELEYDESSSSEEEQSLSEKYDDAVAEVNQLKGKAEDFDNDFDDLRPAAVEAPAKATVTDDMFGDEFDDLKVAEDDLDDDIDQVEISITDQFTELELTHAAAQAFSPIDSQNNEWEQLFAGFGNAATGAPPAPAPAPVEQATATRHDLSIEELIGMGFQRDEVVRALENEQWDLEAATNYLLDHA